MKPLCEKVIPDENSSWRYFRYEWDHMDLNWHYHPEYEICLTLNSYGMRYVGDHIARYGDYDLVIIGPDMPHGWQSEANLDVLTDEVSKDDGLKGGTSTAIGLKEPVLMGSASKNRVKEVVYVAQIPAAWLHQIVNEQRELASLNSLLTHAKRGVLFSEETARKAHSVFIEMEMANPFKRYILLLELLALLQQDSQQELLSSTLFTHGSKLDFTVKKLDKVIEHIYDNYTQALSAQDLAKLAHMSTNHFHRFFKKRTEKTLTEFINQLRIAKACKLLLSNQSPISTISDQCGFNNLSNFNRRFIQFKGVTPSRFRQRFSSKQRAI
ncbi:transcriptional regulator, AraC family [Shewanella baltica OS183]|uniref:AraC family transcriptional regulator n=1 Tax=Shewanella baltica TaxID=62322 RepID=UPI0001E10E35|nr:AraC family transcriptional regulator [Shewanella baltica]AEG12167.1 transcriptional regulator, AraC family [Shewanella baltica BA175]EHQ14295.1 transcriptional regulator, AraC family [Shewanella baltica OS183]